MRRKMMRAVGVLLAVLMMLGCGLAETVRGDLSQRFDVETVEYAGESYRVKNRLTTVLAMGIGIGEAGERRADLAMILAVDDDTKTFSVIEIPENMIVQVPGEAEGEVWNMRFADAWMLGEDANENALRMTQLANSLLGEERIEHYLAFDLEGMQLIENGSLAQGDTRTQLKALKAWMEGQSSSSFTDSYKLLGDYIITDLKSGAVMKIADKADRYEILPRMAIPGTEADAGDESIVLVPQQDLIFEILVSAFYEPDIR